MEAAVRSEMPRNANKIARKAVAGVDLSNAET
jgi:hypothetical protein